MAKALLKKHIDDDVSVETPNGVQHYIITDIKYN